MVFKRIPGSSYYTKDYQLGAALIRARRPYLVRNAVTGIGLWCFCLGVYSWTIHAVAQDDFEDVKVPDAPRQPILPTDTIGTDSAGK